MFWWSMIGCGVLMLMAVAMEVAWCLRQERLEKRRQAKKAAAEAAVVAPCDTVASRQ